MQPKAPKLLADIADAAAFILSSVRDKGAEVYRRDRLLRQLPKLLAEVRAILHVNKDDSTTG